MKHNNVAKHAHKYNKHSVHMDKKKHSKLNAPWQIEELLEEDYVDGDLSEVERLEKELILAKKVLAEKRAELEGEV